MSNQTLNSNNQTNLRFGYWVLIIGIYLVFGTWLLVINALPSFAIAQEDAPLVSLAQRIIESKPSDEVGPIFDELTSDYFKNNKFDDCVIFLKSLAQKRSDLAPVADYYIALSRFRQLKRLEDTQGWDEYFAKGNDYRQEFEAAALKAASLLPVSSPEKLKAKALLWRFHHDQQDALSAPALADLMSGVNEYAAQATAAQAIKDAADQLFEAGEKQKSQQVYKKYAEQLIKAEANDLTLKDAAQKFYQQKNILIAGALYDAYIQRRINSASKEEVLPELAEGVKLFSAALGREPDAALVENLCAKIEELGTKEALTEELSYLRAFTREQSKDFLGAVQAYLDFSARFPQAAAAQKAEYKAALFTTYIAKDLLSGKAAFEKLTQNPNLSPWVAAGIYQLGILSQWEGDNQKAKGYYDSLIAKAGNNFGDSLFLAGERLKEIADLKPMDYNLRTFMDIALKNDAVPADILRLDLTASPYQAGPNSQVNLSALNYPTDSGCMQPELQYLWSGYLGTQEAPGVNSFTTSYAYPGSKEVNLIVVSPSGVLGYSIDVVDVE